MEQKINIDNLDDLQKQALVCMYYAMLPKTDARYKQRILAKSKDKRFMFITSKFLFFSENYFYKELVYADLKFTPTGGTEIELADLIINLEDIILAI